MIIAIVGRTNVGKSTIFNRLSGKKIALVHDQAGVTRDRIINQLEIEKHKFQIIDTPGLEKGKKDDIVVSAWSQTLTAIDQADAIVFVIDARSGIGEQEKNLSRTLKKTKKPILLVANKAENHSKTLANISESFALGLGEPLLLSAEHGLGIVELEQAMVGMAEEFEQNEEEIIEDEDVFTDEPQEKKIKIAILGRPNVGKSTLVNSLAGDERVLTGPIAGITRDPITINFSKFGKEFEIVDTAGLRKRSKVSEELEFVSALKSKEAADKASVVILVIDALLGLEKQDLTIANSVLDEGRVLILAVNKWDSVEDKPKVVEEFKYRMSLSLQQVKNIKIVPISALHGDGINNLFKEVISLYETWNIRVTTGKLNRFLEQALEKYPPPMSKTGRRYKIKYITQAKSRPPTFVLFTSSTEGLPESYERYLANNLAATFKLDGVPLRLNIKKAKNPYAKD